jgi:hypothetical protein
MNSRLRRAFLTCACAATLMLGSFGGARAQAPAAPVIWCAGSAFGTDSQSSSDPFVLAYQHSRQALCEGDAGAAARALTELLPDWRTRYRNDGSHGIDYGRTYFYALIATHNDDGARRFLNELEGDWKPAPEERQFWSSDWVHSFSGYVGDDAQVQRSPDNAAQHKLDPHMTYALADLKANDLPDAVREQQTLGGKGSLYDLMLGNLYAQERDWPHAFTAWIGAASDGPDTPAMEFYTLDRWNVSALEMIYYYRAHAPGNAAAAAPFCGSPHDLATVESLALALPQGTSLDQTYIMDASIAGGVHARVGLQTKGEYFAYFDANGDQWTALAKAPAGVTFPAPCPGARFVNHPSGP